MKVLILVTALLSSTAALAQRYRNTTTTQPVTTTSSAPMSYGSRNEVTANFGLSSGAVNLGGTFAQMNGNTGFGGYLLLQTEKEKAGVNQAISFGGLYKINVLNTANSTFYAAPGFGLSMVKVATTVINPLTLTTVSSTSDKTVFGPNLKVGALMKVTPTFSIGVEHMVVTNWFEETVVPSASQTTLAMTFNL